MACATLLHAMTSVPIDTARPTRVCLPRELLASTLFLLGRLDSLEERQLVERQRDPKDRCRHVVKLTAEGKDQLERLRAITNRIEEEFLAPLSAEDRQTLH